MFLSTDDLTEKPKDTNTTQQADNTAITTPIHTAEQTKDNHTVESIENVKPEDKSIEPIGNATATSSYTIEKPATIKIDIPTLVSSGLFIIISPVRTKEASQSCRNRATACPSRI